LLEEVFDRWIVCFGYLQTVKEKTNHPHQDGVKEALGMRIRPIVWVKPSVLGRIFDDVNLSPRQIVNVN
jgi:hypothetical protein